MALSRWQRTIVNETGDIQPFAQITVLNEETQGAAAIYADRNGNSPLANGVATADASGFVYFYTEVGRYRIQSAGLQIDWRDVEIGDAALRQELANPAGADLVGLGEETVSDAILADRAALANRAENLFSSLIVTVGSSGDFLSINSALEAVSRRYSGYVENGFSVEIKLLSGFIMQEQISVKNGLNLSWITITSEDAEVVIERSSLTTSTYTVNQAQGQDSPRAVYPVFTAVNGSSLPKINVLFSMDASGDATQRIGIFLAENSFGHVGEGCGIKNTGGNGIELVSSSIYAKGCNFSGAGTAGIYASTRSEAEVSFGNFDNVGGIGIYCHRSSRVECRAVSAQYAGDCGLKVHHGGYAGALYANFSYAQGDAGVYARHAAVIDADTLTVNGCTNLGVYSLFGSVIDVSASTITGNGNGILAEAGGHIAAGNAIITDNIGHNVWATNGGSVACPGADLRRAGSNGIQASSGSIITAFAADCRLAGTFAVGVATSGQVRAANILYTDGKGISTTSFNEATNNGGIIWGSRAA